MRARMRTLGVCLLLAGAVCTDGLGATANDLPGWVRQGPLGKTPARVTPDYPLSDQANAGGWHKYEPMCDEFEAETLDQHKWHDRNPGWLGRQPAFFSPGNVAVRDGKLHLTMRKEPPPEYLKAKGYHTYSSAAVQSTTRVLYGYFEIQARPMKSHGSSSFWFYDHAPDLWTEIDVFEIGGGAPGFERKYNMNVHVLKTPQADKHWSSHGLWQAPADLADADHVYGFEWDQQRLTWYIDGVPVRWVENTHWHQPLTLNFDSETMPDWFGLPHDEDLPSTYSIEYVRAWKKRDPQSRPLFGDMRFERGFLLKYPDVSHGRATEAVLDLGEPANKPVWHLAQWATKYSLAEAECRREPNGDRVYENTGKRVLVGGSDSPNRDLILELRGKAEYGDRPRRQGEGWPHLLVEQDVMEMYPLSRLARLDFHVLLRLLAFEDHMAPADFDPGLHAAQFQLFLVVRNADAASKDHNEYLWFGVPFFDSRHDIPISHQAKDAGKEDATGKFIYAIDGREVNHLPMKTKTWVTFQADLLPHIQAGLQTAAERGFLTDTDPSHYAVVNMNLGWEMPGTYDAAIQVRDLRIDAILK